MNFTNSAPVSLLGRAGVPCEDCLSLPQWPTVHVDPQWKWSYDAYYYSDTHNDSNYYKGHVSTVVQTHSPSKMDLQIPACGPNTLLTPRVNY